MQSRLNLGESKSQMGVDVVISLMNPKNTIQTPTPVKILFFDRFLRVASDMERDKNLRH